MHSYRLSPEGIDHMQRRAWPKVILVVLLMPLLLWMINSMANEPLAPPLLVGAATVLLLGAIAAVRRALRRTRDAWATYELLISENTVVTRQLGKRRVEINRDDITRILDRPSGLYVRASGGLRNVFVPAEIENFDHARTVLSSWRPIERGWMVTSGFVALLVAVVAVVLYLAMKYWR